MGFLDFFKSKPKEEFKLTTLETLPNLLQDELYKIQNSDNNPSALIKSRIKEFSNELINQIAQLKSLDIKKTQSVERLQFILEKNLNNYISHLESLLKNLSEPESQDLDNQIQKIQLSFTEFEQKSSNSYHKADFLIGDKLNNNRQLLGNFSKDFRNILEKNKTVTQNIRSLTQVKSKLNELNSINLQLLTIKKKSSNLEKQIANLNTKNKKLNSDINEIKSSLDFKTDQNLLAQHQSQIENLKKSFFQLKELIDFKALSKMFHAIEKKTKIISSHKENFQQEILKDSGLSLQQLLDNSSLNSPQIKEKLQSLLAENEALSEKKFKEFPIKNLESQIEKNNTEITSLQFQKSRNQKKLDKIFTNKEQTISVLKDELLTINIQLI